MTNFNPCGFLFSWLRPNHTNLVTSVHRNDTPLENITPTAAASPRYTHHALPTQNLLRNPQNTTSDRPTASLPIPINRQPQAIEGDALQQREHRNFCNARAWHMYLAITNGQRGQLHNPPENNNSDSDSELSIATSSSSSEIVQFRLPAGLQAQQELNQPENNNSDSELSIATSRSPSGDDGIFPFDL